MQCSAAGGTSPGRPGREVQAGRGAAQRCGQLPPRPVQPSQRRAAPSCTRTAARLPRRHPAGRPTRLYASNDARPLAASPPLPPVPQLDFPANIMLDGGLELLPAGAAPGAGANASAGVELEAPVEPGATATYSFYVPERCTRGLVVIGRGLGRIAAAVRPGRPPPVPPLQRPDNQPAPVSAPAALARPTATSPPWPTPTPPPSTWWATPTPASSASWWWAAPARSTGARQ